MAVVERTLTSNVLGGDPDPGGDQRRRMVEFPAAEKPTLSPDLVSRFHALVEEVTDELMQGQSFDRKTCRADAITILVATIQQQSEGAAEAAESPLMYLLLEEQHKATAAAGKAEPGGPAFTYLKA